jgi:ketosteroid isomerase-like protein
MKRAMPAYVAVVVVLLASAGVASADQQQDQAAIRALQVRQADAWNRHDAAAYAWLFTDDADVVNVVGWWWKGRAEIEGKLKQALSFVFAESTLQTQVLQRHAGAWLIAAFQNTNGTPEVPFPTGPPAGTKP